MVSDWKEVTLGDLVDFTPKRTIKKGAIAPFVSMADVTENSKFITKVFEKEFTGGGSRFVNGDTLFARITPCLQNGKCSKVSGVKDNEIGHGSTEFIIMAAKAPEYDEDYIYYLARLPKFRAYAESRMIGSTGRQRVSWQDLEEYEFYAPIANERKQIGSFLSSLDDKIELNRQMNETLEAMAQALFKSWFVDFDPVIDNALAVGNAIPDEMLKRAEQRTGIEKKDNSDIQSLFPDTFEFTEEMGWIPKGWESESFGDVSMCFDRLRVPLSKRERENKKPGIIPYHGATSVMDYINEWIFDDIYLLIGEDGSVIKEDGSPFVQYIWGKTWVNNHAHVLQGRNGVSTEHLMLFMQSQNLTAYITGAVQLKINQGNMNRIPFLNAGRKINEKFEAIINPFYEKLRSIADENENLVKIRDTLLPKLMSGEIRISDAEALVNEIL